MSMASVSRIIPIFWVIVFAVGKINAAVLQANETIDLDVAINKDESTAANKTNESGHLTVNDSKVIIDLYSSAQLQASTPSKSLKDESADKNVTPLVQLVINQPDSIGSNVPSKNPITEIPATENPDPPANPSPLIPPASIDASINKLEKDAVQKQGQIIIRYEFFYVPSCFLFATTPF